MEGFFCDLCGQHHEHLPMSYGVYAPIDWSDDHVNDPLSELSQDLCVIKGEHFFIKGNDEIPIRNSKKL
jgi:hypothetical protein